MEQANEPTPEPTVPMSVDTNILDPSLSNPNVPTTNDARVQVTGSTSDDHGFVESLGSSLQEKLQGMTPTTRATEIQRLRRLNQRQRDREDEQVYEEIFINRLGNELKAQVRRLPKKERKARLAALRKLTSYELERENTMARNNEALRSLDLHNASQNLFGTNSRRSNAANVRGHRRASTDNDDTASSETSSNTAHSMRLRIRTQRRDTPASRELSPEDMEDVRATDTQSHSPPCRAERNARVDEVEDEHTNDNETRPDSTPSMARATGGTTASTARATGETGATSSINDEREENTADVNTGRRMGTGRRSSSASSNGTSCMLFSYFVLTHGKQISLTLI